MYASTRYILWCTLLVTGWLGGFIVLSLDNAAVRSRLATQIFNLTRTLTSDVSLQLVSELTIVFLESLVNATWGKKTQMNSIRGCSCLYFLPVTTVTCWHSLQCGTGLICFCNAVVLGVSGAIFMILGLFSCLQSVQNCNRRHARRVNRALKARGCHPRYSRSTTTFFLHRRSLSGFTLWIPAAVVVVSLLYLHPRMPTDPIDHSTQALHHPSATLTLPPSHLPLHPQWFDPARRDHIHWLEDLGSTISTTLKASRDLWTSQLPTVLHNDQHQQRGHTTRVHIPADTVLWAWPNATCPYLHRIDSTDRSGLLTSFPNGNAFAHMGAVWRSTSAAAPAYSAYHAVSALQYTQPTMPASMIPPAASLPTAVEFSAATATGQAALMSTAVAIHRTTPPFMAWADIFWPLSSSGYTTVITLQLSNPSVESLVIALKYQATAAALKDVTSTPTIMTSNISTACLPELRPSLCRSAATHKTMPIKFGPQSNTSTGMHIRSDMCTRLIGKGCTQFVHVLSYPRLCCLLFGF